MSPAVGSREPPSPGVPADATTVPGTPSTVAALAGAAPREPCLASEAPDDGTPEDGRPVGAALLAAVALGALGDVLFRNVPLGLNLTVWAAAALAVTFALARQQGRPVTVAAGLLGALALAFAACVAWRDAGTLAGLALLGLATAVCALARALRDGSAWAFDHAEAAAYAAGAWAVAGEVVAGARTLGGRRRALREWGRAGAAARGGGVAVRGTLLAAPVLAVFGLLLSAADGAFARLVSRALAIDLTGAAEHVVWTAVGAWAMAGYLVGALFAVRPGSVAAGGAPPPAALGVRGWRPQVGAAEVGVAEVGVALALVDALLGVFVAVQLGRLLGGRVGAGNAGLAEYARRGFFELAAVVALALPLLVAASATVARVPGSAAARRAYRWAAGFLIVLLGALVVAAADRIRLYQAAYGLTELRVYVLACLAWLAAVFAWAAATLLRGRPAAFALGGALSAWLWIFALHALDPAALVVRINAARASVGEPLAPRQLPAPPGDRALDVHYLASLGADAVPELTVRVLPRVAAASDTTVRCAAAEALGRALAHAEGAEAGGWRSWNLARRRAARAAAHVAGPGAPGAWRDGCTPLDRVPRPLAPSARTSGAG